MYAVAQKITPNINNRVNTNITYVVGAPVYDYNEGKTKYLVAETLNGSRFNINRSLGHSPSVPRIRIKQIAEHAERKFNRKLKKYNPVVKIVEFRDGFEVVVSLNLDQSADELKTIDDIVFGSLGVPVK